MKALWVALALVWFPQEGFAGEAVEGFLRFQGSSCYLETAKQRKELLPSSCGRHYLYRGVYVKAQAWSAPCGSGACWVLTDRSPVVFDPLKQGLGKAKARGRAGG